MCALVSFSSVAGRWTPRARCVLWGVAAAQAQALRAAAALAPTRARTAATLAAEPPPPFSSQLTAPTTTSGPISGPEFDSLLRALEPPHRGDTVLVAVSGGPDSLALLTLMSQWCRQHGVLPLSVTVDHGLRPESAAEAAGVQAFAERRLGIPHVTYRLDWDSPSSGEGASGTNEGGGSVMESGTGGTRLPRRSQLQTVARARRYAALADVARAAGASLIYTGHTLNDQLETMLYRFSRSSGVVGLAGMRGRTLLPCGTAALIRPLLQVPKQRLLDTCEQQELLPVQDPSNSNPAFDRVRIRRAMAGLNVAGDGPPAPPAASPPLPFDLLSHASQVLAATASDIQSEVSALITQCCRIHPTEGYVMLWPHRLLGAGAATPSDAPTLARAELLAKLALARLLTVCSGRDLPVSSSSIEEALTFMRRVTKTAALARSERAVLMPKGSWPSLATGQCLLKVMLTAEGKQLCQPQMPPPLPPGAAAGGAGGAGPGDHAAPGASFRPALLPGAGGRRTAPPAADDWQALLASEGISGPVEGSAAGGDEGSAGATDDGVHPDALQVLVLRETASLHRRKATSMGGAAAAGGAATAWRGADSLLLARPTHKEGSAAATSASSLPSRGVALPSGLPVAWDNLFQLTCMWRPLTGPYAKAAGGKARSGGGVAPPGALEGLAPPRASGAAAHPHEKSPAVGLAAVRLSADEWEYLSFLYPELQPALKAFKDTCPVEALAGLPVGVLVNGAGVPVPVARLGKNEGSSAAAPLPTLADIAAAVAAAPAPPAHAAVPPPPRPQPSAPPAAPSRQLVAGLKALDEKARLLMRRAAEEATAAAAAAATHEGSPPADREPLSYPLAPPLSREAVDSLLDEALLLLESCAAQAPAAAPGAAEASSAAVGSAVPAATRGATVAASTPTPTTQTTPPRAELPHMTRLRMYNQVMQTLQAQGATPGKAKAAADGSKGTKGGKGAKSGTALQLPAAAGSEGTAPLALFARPWWHPTRRAHPSWAEAPAAAGGSAKGGAAAPASAAAGSKDTKPPPLQMASLQSFLRAITSRHAAAAGAAGSSSSAPPCASSYWSRPVVLKAASLWENVDKQVVEAVVAVPHLRFCVWPELTMECRPLLKATAPGDSSVGITTP